VLSSRNPSIVGQPVTLTAQVSSPGSTLVPTGSVEFIISNSPNVAVHEVVPLDSGGVATLVTANLSVGVHAVSVSYPNASPFAGSVGVLTQTVTRAPTAALLTTSRASSVWGQLVTFTAYLSPRSAQGAVDFLVDGKMVAHAVVNANGIATLSSSTLTVGAHTVLAKYAGSGLNAPATSPPLTQTVTQARSRVTLTSSLSSAQAGTMLRFTAVVAAASTGVGTPTGSVQFFVDGSFFGAAPLVHGRAGMLTSLLGRGRHTVQAKYMGNPRTFLLSSSTITQRVM